MSSLASLVPVAALFPSPLPFLALPELEARDDLLGGRDGFINCMREASPWQLLVGALPASASIQRAFSCYHGWMWDHLHTRPRLSTELGMSIKLFRTIALAVQVVARVKPLLALLPASVGKLVKVGLAAGLVVGLAIVPAREFASRCLYFDALGKNNQELAELEAREWSKSGLGIDLGLSLVLAGANLVQAVVQQNKSFVYANRNPVGLIAGTAMTIAPILLSLYANALSAARAESGIVIEGRLGAIRERIAVVQAQLSSITREQEENASRLEEFDADLRLHRERLTELRDSTEDAFHLIREEGSNTANRPPPFVPRLRNLDRLPPQTYPPLGQAPLVSIQGAPLRRVAPPVRRGMVLNVATLRADPMSFLARMEDYEGESLLTIGVRLIENDGRESPAVDAGGPSRQVLGELFRALQEHGHLKLLDGCLVFGKGEDKAFRGLGVLFADLLREPGFAIPSSFRPSLFRTLAMSLEMGCDPESIRDLFALVLAHLLLPDSCTPKQLLDLLIKEEWSPEQREMAEIYTDGCEGDPRVELAKVASEFLDDIGIRPLVAVAQGMRNRFGDDWRQEHRNWPTWRVRMVGQELHDLELPVVGRGLGSDWVRQWWGEATLEKRKSFLIAVNGSEWLPPDTNIFVCTTGASNQGYPAIHSCSHQLDVPRYEGYDEFAEKLEVSLLSVERELSQGDSGFHQA